MYPWPRDIVSATSQTPVLCRPSNFLWHAAAEADRAGLVGHQDPAALQVDQVHQGRRATTGGEESPSPKKKKKKKDKTPRAEPDIEEGGAKEDVVQTM